MHQQQHQQQQLFRPLVPAVDPAEPRSRRCWEWVCGALVNKDKGECNVSVLDTVFIEKQQIWSWFYSSSGGVIRKKPRAQLSVEAVHHALCRIAGHTSSAQPLPHVAVCWFGDQIRTMQLFNAHELLTFLNSLASSDSSACLSAFVLPRGGDLDPLKYANLEHNFALSKTGRPQCKLFRLALGSQRILSMDAKANAQVNDLVQHYVSYVEKSKRVRVVHCVSLFVLDDFGRLFLWRTDAFETIAAATSTPALSQSLDASLTLSSPAASAMAHQAHHHQQQQLQQRVYDGPHAVNERILARAKVEALRKPDDKLIDAILSSPTPQPKRSLLLASSSSTPSLSSTASFDPFRDEKLSQLRNASDWDDALQYLPASSSLSRGRRRTISAAHLVSSQKRGCSGDYCHVELAALTAKRMTANSSSGSQKSPGPSHRLSQSLQLASPSLTSPSLDADARRRSSVFTATAAANAFLEARARDDPHSFEPRIGNSRQSSKHSARESVLKPPPSPQKEQQSESTSQVFAIPFKFIAQTRAEKPLVDLFVRRYRNGEDGAYLAEAYYGDGDPLGTTFPGYYYQEVHVCRNCFDFYSLIERVRMRAQDQVASSSSKKKTKKKRQHQTLAAMTRVERELRDRSPLLQAAASSAVQAGHSANIAFERLTEREDDDADSDGDDSSSDTSRIWMPVWQHAKAAIRASFTKHDAAELYSFANPHPAVAMVLSSLNIVLLGRVNGASSTGDWTELKRSVSQEKLLSLLQTFELEQLSLDRAMRAAAHARNPLFSPLHIAPVSSCAARLCDWILAVLQAYAWKYARAFRDDDTNRVLRFLRPELLPRDADRWTPSNANASAPLPSDARSQQLSQSATAAKATATSSSTGRQRDAARRAIQAQQMARLAAPSGLADATAVSGTDAVFTCQDGVTTIPYTIAGQAVGASTKCNLVVFHDLFDTMDSTKVFYRAVLARNVGARALFFNLPGQAGAAVGADTASDRVVLNNVWYAQRVHELLSYVQHTRAFALRGLPFHIVGFGNGANVAACYTITFGKSYGASLQSLVLCNGFASVDAQLAAVLHSAVNVFTCFPPARPDLPVSFFSKFLFSDAYLSKVDANLALSIYTAVTNAITLDGRIRICQGALLHVDLAAQLDAIDVPLVLVQSIENALIAPGNVDAFLQGRSTILHAWSHQQQQQPPATSGADIHSKTRKQLQHVLATRKSAFVSWLRAGHELRQECKTYMTELMELLVNANELGESDAAVAAESVRPTSAEQESEAPRERTGSVRRRQSDTSAASARARLDSGPLGTEGGAPHVPTGLLESPQASAALASTAAAPRISPLALDTQLIDERGQTNTSASRKQRLPQHQPAPATPAPLAKSAYELQLERSEEAFQAAVRTHEAQKAALAKNHRLGVKDDVAAAAPVAFPSTAHLAPPPSLPLPVATASAAATTSIAPSHGASGTAPAAPLDPAIDALREAMVANEQRAEREAEELRIKQRAAAQERMAALQQEQERRRREWEEEDRARLAAMERALQAQQEERLAAAKARELELLELDVSASLAAINSPSVAAASTSTLRQQLEQQRSPPPTLSGDALRTQIRMQPELPSMFDELEAAERAKKRIGRLRVDEFAAVKTSMDQSYRDGVHAHERSLEAKLLQRKHASATRIQTQIRRFVAVRRVCARRARVQHERITRFAGGEIVRIVRGFLGRRRFIRCRQERAEMQQRALAAVVIQRLQRGHVCRVAFRRKLRAAKAIVLQRVYRGHVGRLYCDELRDALAQRRYMDRNAAKIQATWRMHTVREQYLTARVSVLAAIEIQRVYRGHVGRVDAARKKQWRDAEPGPERLALGLEMIEGSKRAFERQQSEIDALHRAQEAVERQVSAIHSELQESEQELAVLERELQEIDQLEADLRELTHEAELLHSGGVEGLLRSHAAGASGKQPTPLGSGVPPSSNSLDDIASAAVPYEAGVERLFESKDALKARQADAYAVEMAIQIKRSERERRKRDLDAEFASVFSEVQQKRAALAAMESKLADMEATRMRKDREVARLQRNLMELLEEQKLELERLREKGIELETATATSAAAAAATALKAKEHEKQSQAMFASTEELMKFQFMSMSLSYFSSLSMLKNLRDINADTTAAAITSTAETAAVAAAAAAAANIPAMTRLKVGGADLMTAASTLKQQQLAQQLADEDAAKRMQLQPLPPEVRDWSVDDVGRWLDALALPQYKQAFAEGAVDGAFLLELRPEDMADVLGVTHKLHVRKLVVARNKLLPLTQQERAQLDAVEHEASASATRTQASVPDVDTVFSQARNGRLKRVIESLDAGFPVDEEDEKGNTLLLLACQNVNMKMVELLVAKRANVNHKNAQGNTALHFAMAYDADGALGEYLIARGADDTIENAFGLTPYDGLSPE